MYSPESGCCWHTCCKLIQLKQGWSPGVGMVGRFRGDDPRFWDFQSDWVSFLYLNTIWLTPSFCINISLSLSHLIQEILGPKIGLFFHQNVLFDRFKTFCIKFLLDFQINWPPFSLILDFLTPHLYKTLDPIGPNFFSCADPGYQKFCEVTQPPPQWLPITMSASIVTSQWVMEHKVVPAVWSTLREHILVIQCYLPSENT